MKRFFLLSALVALFVLTHGTAQAGLYVTIDIDDDGILDGAGFSSGVDVPIAAAGASGFGLIVSSTITSAEAASMSFVNTTDTTIRITAPTTDRVRIQVLYTDLELPAGTPLVLQSAVSTVGAPNIENLVTASNNSFLESGIAVTPGAPPIFTLPLAGGLLAAIPGEEFNPFSDTENEVRARPVGIPPGEFDLASDILIVFTGLSTTGEQLQVQTSTSVKAAPEASSILAWGLCAGFGLLVAWRRKRRA